MPERRPDPRDPRASLVDSGWSEPEPPERVLPRYEDAPREHLITRIDDQIQSRLDEMRESVASERAPNSFEVTKVGGAPNDRSKPGHSKPEQPKPEPPKAEPPKAEQAAPRPSSMPPPPPSRPRTPLTLPPPSRPPPPALGASPSLPPVPVMPRSSQLPPAPVARSSSQLPPAPVARSSSLPPAPALPQALATPVVAAPSMPAPAPLPPVQPFRPSVNPFSGGSSLAEALTQRIRVGAGDLPLWGILAPLLFGVLVVGVMLAYLIFGSKGQPPAVIPEAESVPRSGADVAPAPAPTPGEPSRSGSPLEKAASGDAAALAALERKKPEELRAEEALALAQGRTAQAVANVRKLRERLASDPGLIKDPKVAGELLRASQSPETARDALAAMAAVPGPISADLLYEIWTGTVERSGNTELARALLLGRDVRAKASPPLLVAIELRETETCEGHAKLLPRATEVGDKRAFGPLSRLLRRTGCGPGKKSDCYPCLRTGDALKNALEAVKLRRAPEFLRQ